MIKKLPLLFSILMVSLISQVSATDLTVSQLENGKYFVPSWEDQIQGEWVQLRDGEYNRNNPDNFLLVKIVDIALGPLSPGRTKDAAVIYGYNTGGTGFFMMLCAVVDDQGKLTNSEPVDM